jgi:membrane protein required for colicin V production
MSWLDILILLPLLVGLVIGIKRGLIIELTNLISIVAGAVCARLLSAPVTIWIAQQFTWPEAVCSVVAYTLLFLTTSILMYLLGKLLTKLFKAVKLGWLNRLLGGLFGLAKYAIIVLFIVLCVDRLDTQFQFIQDDLKAKSVVYKAITPLSEDTWQTLKEQLSDIKSQKNEQNQ